VNVYGWELSQFNENAAGDSINIGDDPSRAELELQHMLSEWPSQPDPTGSQTFEQIHNFFSHNELHGFSGAITGDAPRTCDPVGNDGGSPGVSLIHTAAKRGHVNIVRLLLEHDANYDIRDEDGLTPLIHATIGGCEEVTGLLLSHGASIRLTDEHNRSALHWAVIHRHDRLLKLLLKHCTGDRSVVDCLTIEGKTPLQIAVDTDFEAAVELLLNSGADVQHMVRKSRNVGIDSYTTDGAKKD
jgi:ankyrin repeat protein